MLPELGKYCTLDIVKLMSFGAYLDGGPFGEVLLPKSYVPKKAKVGDSVKVFLYCDSEDRVIATALKPLAIVGQFAYLKAVDVNQFGAFLDWGIPMKHLFVPFREQVKKMEVGRSYVVYVYLDSTTDRIVASSRLKRFLKQKKIRLAVGESVDILVFARTELGYKVIVNQRHEGLIYRNEVFQVLKQGENLKGFVKNIREDNKLDISLQKQGAGGISEAATKVLEQVKKHQGFLPLTDKSKPEAIYGLLKMSKKSFKKAVGNLYKRRLVRLEKRGIRLVK